MDRSLLFIRIHETAVEHYIKAVFSDNWVPGGYLSYKVIAPHYESFYIESKANKKVTKGANRCLGSSVAVLR